MTFVSNIKRIGYMSLPKFSDMRIMMLPFLLENIDTLPDDLTHWRDAVIQLCELSPVKTGVAYLTIDEKCLKEGQTHRRAGLHVDGVYKNGAGGWGGGGGAWGKSGLLTVSSHLGCRVWNQSFIGQPGEEGECDHLAIQCKPECEVLLEPFEVYWLGSHCVHESLPMITDVMRTFVRLSMPSRAPWFEGYTVNPKGIKPTGPILPRREFMHSLEYKINM